jgi:uncharacterized membrane protein (GlpM family)
MQMTDDELRAAIWASKRKIDELKRAAVFNCKAIVYERKYLDRLYFFASRRASLKKNLL